MDSLLQRLNGRSSPHDQYNSSSGSVPITPATDEFASTPPTEMDASVLLVEASELQKLKLELQEARNEVNRMNQEMHSQHVARTTMDHLSQSSDQDYSYTGDVTEQTLTQLQNKFNASTRTNCGWANDPARPAYGASNSFGPPYQVQGRPSNSQAAYRRSGFLNEPTHFPLDQSFRSSGMNAAIATGMGNGLGGGLNSGMNSGMNNPPSRPGSAFDPLYNQYAVPSMYPVGHPGPINAMSSRLSPDASEFNVAGGLGPSPWNSQVVCSNPTFTV